MDWWTRNKRAIFSTIKRVIHDLLPVITNNYWLFLFPRDVYGAPLASYSCCLSISLVHFLHLTSLSSTCAFHCWCQEFDVLASAHPKGRRRWGEQAQWRSGSVLSYPAQTTRFSHRMCHWNFEGLVAGDELFFRQLLLLLLQGLVIIVALDHRRQISGFPHPVWLTNCQNGPRLLFFLSLHWKALGSLPSRDSSLHESPQFRQCYR